MEKISKLGLLKGVAELAVTAGVGVIVGNLIRATTPEDVSRLQKVAVYIGGYGLTGVLADLSGKHVANQIDGYGKRFESWLHPTVEAEEPTEEPLTEEEVAAIVEGTNKVLKNKKPQSEEDAPTLSDDHK